MRFQIVMKPNAPNEAGPFFKDRFVRGKPSGSSAVVVLLMAKGLAACGRGSMYGPSTHGLNFRQENVLCNLHKQGFRRRKTVARYFYDLGQSSTVLEVCWEVGDKVVLFPVGPLDWRNGLQVPEAINVLEGLEGRVLVTGIQWIDELCFGCAGEQLL